MHLAKLVGKGAVTFRSNEMHHDRLAASELPHGRQSLLLKQPVRSHRLTGNQVFRPSAYAIRATPD